MPEPLKLKNPDFTQVFVFSLFFTSLIGFMMVVAPYVEKAFATFSNWTRILKLFKTLTFLFFISSLFFWVLGDRFQYANIEGLPPPGTGSYILKSLRSYVLSFGIAMPDRNIVQYALVGFGWLDAIPHYLVTWALFFPISLIIFLSLLNQRQHKKDFFAVECLFIAVLSIVQYSLVSWASLHQMMNLHGRYLLPFFIFQYIWIFERLLPKINFKKTGLVWYLSPLVHFGLTLFILTRYYGKF